MDKLLQMMGLARRANLLLAGEEVVADAIAAHKARLVLLAADASERTGKKIRQMAGETLPVLVLPRLWGMDGVWLSLAAGEILSVTMSLYYFRRFRPLWQPEMAVN